MDNLNEISKIADYLISPDEDIFKLGKALLNTIEISPDDANLLDIFTNMFYPQRRITYGPYTGFTDFSEELIFELFYKLPFGKDYVFVSKLNKLGFRWKKNKTNESRQGLN